VDCSFVAKPSTGHDITLTIVQAVVSLARVLKITAVAEGVETEQQLAMVKAAGCAEAQGYIFSPPKPAKEIAQLFPSRSEPAVSAA